MLSTPSKTAVTSSSSNRPSIGVKMPREQLVIVEVACSGYGPRRMSCGELGSVVQDLLLCALRAVMN
jgi:hypothetical protein